MASPTASGPVLRRRRTENDAVATGDAKADAPSSSTATRPTTSAARQAARGTATTILLRLASFACSQYTIRTLNPQTLGQTSIQLELLLTTVLFMSREGFRISLTSSKRTSDDFRVWNVAWLSLPLSTMVAATALLWHLFYAPTSSHDFVMGGAIYCLAAMIEGWAEPAVLHTLRQLDTTVKAAAEGTATLAKTLTTVLLLSSSRFGIEAVTALALAQLVYAMVYFMIMYSRAWSGMKGLNLPPTSRPWSFGVFDSATCYMTLLFTIQGLFKHVLTEADRIVLTSMSGTYDQGVYAMGAAYGGLAARMLLQPLEENARLWWSHLAAQPTTQSSTDPLEESYVVLVKTVLYIGAIFSCLGVNYTRVLLNLLAGRTWGGNQEATLVLSAFCVYTAFLAWNGMTEAFVYAVSTTGRDLGRLGAVHTAIAAIFTMVAWWAVPRYGTVGLVGANIVAMFLRGSYALYFAALYFAKRQDRPATGRLSAATRTVFRLLYRGLPAWDVMVMFSVACWMTQRSDERLIQKALAYNIAAGTIPWFRLALNHVAVGVAAGVGLLFYAYAREREFRGALQRLWHEKAE
jgi:oligosaccharide translocation protein RFT1